jgi:hypothetical protein
MRTATPDALLTAYEATAPRLNATFEQFQQAAKDFEVIPVTVDGKTVGAILRNGPELHACIKPEGFKRWFRKEAKGILEETIARHGYAMTRVMEGNEIGDAFVKRLGFVEWRRETGVIFYKKV